MNLVEAIKSKKRFKRKSDKEFRETPFPSGECYGSKHSRNLLPLFSHYDLMADDWEVEDKNPVIESILNVISMAAMRDIRISGLSIDDQSFYYLISDNKFGYGKYVIINGPYGEIKVKKSQ